MGVRLMQRMGTLYAKLRIHQYPYVDPYSITNITDCFSYPQPYFRADQDA